MNAQLEQLERTLPASPDTEKLVLGSIQINGDRFADVSAVLTADDFFLEKHRRIFARMKDLYERGERIDRISLMEELRRNGQLESVDGASYLVDLDLGLPLINNLDGYLRIVKDASTRRAAITVCHKIIGQCMLSGEPSEDVMDTASALLERVVSQGTSKHGQWVTPGDVLRSGVDSVLFPARGSDGIQTPWPRLTEMTSGWNPGDLVIVAGRPGMGKSVIGMQQTYTTALQGVGVGYISLEMSKESLVRRLVAGISRVDAHRARSGYESPDERRRMLEAASDLETVPLFIDESRAHTPVAVGAALRKLRAKTNVGLIVVDHLQLMKVIRGLRRSIGHFLMVGHCGPSRTSGPFRKRLSLDTNPSICPRTSLGRMVRNRSRPTAPANQRPGN